MIILILGSGHLAIHIRKQSPWQEDHANMFQLRNWSQLLANHRRTSFRGQPLDTGLHWSMGFELFLRHCVPLRRGTISDCCEEFRCRIVIDCSPYRVNGGSFRCYPVEHKPMAPTLNIRHSSSNRSCTLYHTARHTRKETT